MMDPHLIAKLLDTSTPEGERSSLLPLMLDAPITDEEKIRVVNGLLREECGCLLFAAISAVGPLGDDVTKDILTAIMQKVKDEYARASALNAFARLEGHILPQMVRNLESADEGTRQLALNGIADNGSSEAIGLLRNVLNNHWDKHMQYSAAFHLALCRQTDGEDLLWSSVGDGRFSMDDENAVRELGALVALCQFPRKDAFARLRDVLAVLRTECSVRDRDLALHVLKKLPFSDAPDEIDEISFESVELWIEHNLTS